MGNTANANKQQTESQVAAVEGPFNPTDVIDVDIPFNDLPELFGPIDGYYYHIKDKNLLQQNRNVQFGFRYNGIDYDPLQIHDINNKKNKKKMKNSDEKKSEEDDDDDDDDNNQPLFKYNKCRYEWIYITDDNIAFHKIKEPSYYHPEQHKMTPLPEEYEKIRSYLAVNDPIPPYFSRQSKMAGMVFQGASKSSLCEVRKLKCRIATKHIGEVMSKKVFHPALLIWDRTQQFGKYDDKPVMMIHLTKLPDEFKDEKEKKEDKDRIEIQCKPVSKYKLDEDQWDYSWKEQDLELENGLVDIAHWCLKYEMDNNYQYGKYMTNCREFMIALCNTYKIDYDDKQWTDNVIYVTKKAKDVLSGKWKGNNN